MVSLPNHGFGTAAHPRPPASRRNRSTWLVLSDGAPTLELSTFAPEVDVIVVRDPAKFAHRLAQLRPRIAVCAEPPADQAILDAIARERRRRPGMRVVHLAPPAAVAGRLAALAAGFDDALATTVQPAELAGRLRWLDERAAAARVPQSMIQVTDELVLDLEAHALWRDGVQVHLRPKEFALLALLAANAGRAVRRQDLVARVWGPDRSADSRTVDVHVRWLRAKIEPDPDRAVHLVTVRGVGYRLDPPR